MQGCQIGDWCCSNLKARVAKFELYVCVAWWEANVNWRILDEQALIVTDHFGIDIQNSLKFIPWRAIHTRANYNSQGMERLERLQATDFSMSWVRDRAQYDESIYAYIYRARIAGVYRGVRSFNSPSDPFSILSPSDPHFPSQTFVGKNSLTSTSYGAFQAL